MKYESLCKEILEAVGGRDNIINAFHCITRLRLNFKNENIVDLEKLNQIKGIIKVNHVKDQTQLIIGSHVDEVYEDFIKIAELQKEMKIDENLDDHQVQEKKSFFNKLTNAATQIMLPLLPAMLAGGILKGIMILLDFLKICPETSETYIILYNIGNSSLYFIPILVAITASKYFKTSQVISVMLAGALLMPEISTLLSSGEIKLFGLITIPDFSYASTVVPIILIVIIQKYVEKGLNSFMPKALKTTFTPLFSLVICSIMGFAVIGPIGNMIGETISGIYVYIYDLCPPIAGALIGGAWSVLVMAGLHTALVPIVVNNIATLGYDTLMAFSSTANFGQYGALFGSYFTTKNAQEKNAARDLMIATAAGGFSQSEPVIYGNNIIRKIPFYCGLLGGSIGGAIASIMGARAMAVGGFTAFKFALYAGTISTMVIACGAAFAIGFVLTVIKGGKKHDQ